MNTTEYKYYVYSQNGMVINRVDYSNIVKQHGIPVASSSNGLNFIFKKSLNQVEDQFKNLT